MMKKPDNIKGNNPFKVPENYFEEVSRIIIASTGGNENEIRKIGLYSRFRPYILVAASVTGFILISYSAIRLLSPSRSESLMTEFLSDQSPDSLLNEVDLFSLEESASSITLIGDISGAETSEIIDYLISENISISDIYEKL
jgi:hypothetical protein